MGKQNQLYFLILCSNDWKLKKAKNYSLKCWQIFVYSTTSYKVCWSKSQPFQCVPPGLEIIAFVIKDVKLNSIYRHLLCYKSKLLYDQNHVKFWYNDFENSLKCKFLWSSIPIQCNFDLVTLNLVTTCDLATIFQGPLYYIKSFNLAKHYVI